MEDELIPLLERYSGKKAGQDFGVVFNPEFLREGSSIKLFYDPPFTIIAGTDTKSITMISDLYSFIDAQLIVVPMRVAEMVKYACNAFHDLKITFANEVGIICKVIDIDSHTVMDILFKDTKFNLSPYYLKPGFAFGGSCLPKDLRALLYQARKNDIDALVLESILPSNNNQIDLAYQMVKSTNEKQIGVLGLSFKAGTDELRESPMVELIEKLIGKGYQVSVYDKNVSISQLHGANRIYIEEEIPHIGTILKDSINEVINNSKVIIIGNNSEEFRSFIGNTKPDQFIIDLVRILRQTDRIPPNYQGICW
jgi:GDP-mannose 6-dehydrogenase